jgi:predicted ATPase/class 3 adenylate cyclase
MNSLPTGTVTFLFTDIEGSTKLWEQYPEAMKAALAKHDSILKEIIESNHGYIIKTTGDGVHTVFTTAIDAINASIVAQRNLHSAFDQSSASFALKVRMGVHTGEAELRDNDYYGQTLNRAARIMSAGHGGQILISDITAQVAREHISAEITFLDLGEHHLKGLSQTEKIYQVIAPDLQKDFPTLSSIATASNNLPSQLTSFIGRARELKEAKEKLLSARLLTLIGPGGTGKTRLSLQLGAEVLSHFADGVWFVELAPLADPVLVLQTIANALGVRAQMGRSLKNIVLDFLHAKNLLLVFDNCEHLVEACAQLADEFLHSAPNLKIVASSREALGIGGETVYRVPSLGVPNQASVSYEALARFESIQLFVERARAANPKFDLTEKNAAFVVQICFRLDGIPLAIELAAARVKMLSAEQIAERLDDCFRLLTGGSRTALPRQQTLRALIDWSYSLLLEPEKTLLRRLAVFVGGWTLEAAEAVCGEESGGVEVLDLLTKLVDKSLVFSEESRDEIRYRRLETIRQYSREKFFETDEVETIRNHHLAFYVQYAETAEEHLRGRARVSWIQRLASEQDNLRSAIEWGLARNPESALRLAASLTLFWAPSGFSAEGFRWLQQTLEHMEKTDAYEQPALRAKGLSGLSFLSMSQGDNTNGKRIAKESVALFRQTQDKSGLAYALVVLAYPLQFLGELPQAEAALKESIAIARSEKNVFVLASALANMTLVNLELHGDIETAERYADEAIRLSREVGIEWTASVANEMKGRIATYQKDYDKARTLFGKAVNGYRETGASFNVILVKSALAHMERESGNYEIALEIYRETIVAFRNIGQTGAVAHQLECFGFIAIAWGQSERALQLFAAADALREKGGAPMMPDEQIYFDEQLKALRDRLDKSQVAIIWSKGCALTMEQAIELALEIIYE